MGWRLELGKQKAPAPSPPSTEAGEGAGGTADQTERRAGGAPAVPRAPTGPPPPPKRFTAVLGESGAGKTVYMNAAYAAAIHAGGGRGVYVDAKGDNPYMGAPVRSVGGLLAFLQENRRRSGWSVVLDAQGITRADMAPAWDALRQLGSVVVGLDEADKWIHSGIGNEIRPASLRQLIGWGRSRGVALLATARQPAEVHRDFRNSLSAAVSFRHADGGEALKVARDWFGRPGLAAVLKDLPDLHYLRVDRKTGDVTRGRTWHPGTPEGRALLDGR